MLHNLGPDRREAFDNFGIWEYLAEQKSQGLIKHLGFSMHAKADYLDEILSKHPEMEFVQLQINYADWESDTIESRKCYEIARKHGKPVIVMEPVKGGILNNLPDCVSKVFDEADSSASYPSWAIRFAASLNGVVTVLSGMSTLEQMKDNISFMDDFKPISADERLVINKAQAELSKIPQIPCTACQYCVKGCPKNIAIPGTFEAMNFHLVYDDLKRAKGSYSWQIINAGRASECIACGACEKVCPQSINIIKELADATKLLEA